MGKIAILSVLLLAAFGLDRCTQSGREVRTFSVQEIYVIDGDTLAVGEDRYRLMGFDTPEIRHAQCEEERRMGQAAKQRLIALIADAGAVSLHLEPNRDKYRRFLARAFVTEQDV
ncbi:thermonuclease family protein, partial [Ruegeria sp. HKCCD8929]|uniref:thermonuclease family protein n=1 Tax=Ruegeria sp. HKCCD8929 TaxID=2683006 RepID=UPI0014892AE4